MSEKLARLPIPTVLAEAARTMAPAYLRRRLSRVGVPFVSDGTSTFVYVGDADAVRVVHFMALFPEIPPLERLEGTDLWHVTVELPAGCRVEYQLEVVGEERTQRIVDPLNRRTASDPFGANSVAHAPGSTDPAWTSPAVDARRGLVETFEFDSPVFGGVRTLSAYLPDGFPQAAPYPGVLLHDGSDLIEYAGITTVLDNLIGAGALPPLVAVLMDPVDRNREYMALPQHAAFVVDEVLPHAIAEFHMSTRPADRVLAGASLGAVASVSTAWRRPGVFDTLILLSGTFITATGGRWHRSELLQPVVDFIADFAAAPGYSAHTAWMACGTYEALAADNRAFATVMEGAGVAVHYEEPRDGHHWQSWRNSLGRALRNVVPAPPPRRPGTVAS
jgi:enterochelin esterase family protein